MAELKIGQPVALVTKCMDGKYVSYTEYYYLGNKVLGSFYGEPYHRVCPSMKLGNSTLPQYVVPVNIFEEMKCIGDISDYAVDKIIDANTIDTCGIEYWQSIKDEIEEFARS